MIRAIWAQSTDRIIGDGVKMPWYLPEDLAHFKELTTGDMDTPDVLAPSVFMGRGTWESLPERFRPLPNRKNYVLSTREPGTWSHGAQVYNNYNDFMEKLFTRCKMSSPSFIIGGGKLYEKTINDVDVLEVTIVDVELKNALKDEAVYAPNIPDDFEIVQDSGWLVSEKGKLHSQYYSSQIGETLSYKFLKYERKSL